jgi:hypothetical protein
LFEGDIAGFFTEFHQFLQILIVSNHQCSL